MAIIKIDKRKTESSLKTALIAFAVEFSNKMADAAPADTGNLRRRIRNGWKVEKIGDEWHITFSMPFYAEFLEFGTGIFGPRGRPIQPVSKKALAWMAGENQKYGPTHRFDGSNWYAFKWVRGIKPQPFIRPTFHQHLMPLMKKNLRRFFK